MTEQLIETLIDTGVKAYKRNNRDKLFGRMLDRHETAYVEGCIQPFRYWKEMAVYFAGDYRKEVLPDAIVEVTIDGNDSTLSIEIDDLESEKINALLSGFFDIIGIKEY